MKNVNYNVLKVLHTELDNLWRIEKHYLKDAKKSRCDCPKILKVIQKDAKRHIDMLRRELGAHHKSDKLA